MPFNESCMERCTDGENDPFVFCDGSSGDLTQMYVILKTVFFLVLASVMAVIFSVLGVG